MARPYKGGKHPGSRDPDASKSPATNCYTLFDNLYDAAFVTDFGGRKSFREVKHYKRRKRWLT